MDFGDIESERSSSNLIGVAHIRENRFSQDTQYRPRKSPRKKPKVSRTSASLVIDQLKSIFRRPGDFTPRMRTRRNWRPEFLTKYFRDYQRGCNEEGNVVSQHSKRSFVPEAPKIYSIGLNSGARSLSDSNNLSSSCGVTRNLRKRLNVVRRPMIKYWTAQSTSTSSLPTDISLKAHTNRQTAINCTKSPDIPKPDQKNYHNDQSYEEIEQKNDKSDGTSSLRDDRVAGFFIPDDFNDSSKRQDHKCDRSCVTRDAEIQTLSRKSSRRKRTKKKSRTTSEGVSHHRNYDDESRGRIVAGFHVDSHNSNRRDRHEKSRLCVRVLESKRAEYINKFTAVNQQIEEITATLRETCYSDENSRSNLQNCEERFSSDDAKVNTGRKPNDIESKSAIERRRLKGKNDSINVDRIIEESQSDPPENTQEILHVDINHETPDSSRKNYPKNIITSPISPDRNVNDIFVRDSIRVSSIKETTHPSNKTSKNKKKARCRFVKQISLDLDLTKDDAELREFSVEDEPFDEVYLRNNFVITGDKYTKDLIEDFAVSEKSRYHKKIVEEELGEIAILEDIKKRIDRDFDDPSAGKSETGDFHTVSQNSSNLDRRFYETVPMGNATSIETIDASKSTSLIASGSPNLDSTETGIRDSLSAGAVSEYSTKNSTPSQYFSCTQFTSLISLTENENEIDERAIIARDSHSDLRSHNYNYYDCSHSNLDSSFDRSRSDFESTYDRTAQYAPRNKFLIETINETSDTFEISKDREGLAENEICKHECLLGEEERESCVDFEKRYTIDSTLETSKSSRYIGSIDSGMFSSSLIDLYPTESSFDAGKSESEKKRRARKLDGSSPATDFSSDGSYTDDRLDRRVNDVVRDLTENLILCERRARTKLREIQKAGIKSRYSPSRSCKFNRSLYDAYCDFFTSPRRSSEDERIVSISTPSLLSLSDSEIEDRESKCRL